jgi:hypothetical protein
MVGLSGAAFATSWHAKRRWVGAAFSPHTHHSPADLRRAVNNEAHLIRAKTMSEPHEPTNGRAKATLEYRRATLCLLI